MPREFLTGGGKTQAACAQPTALAGGRSLMVLVGEQLPGRCVVVDGGAVRRSGSVARASNPRPTPVWRRRRLFVLCVRVRWVCPIVDQSGCVSGGRTLALMRARPPWSTRSLRGDAGNRRTSPRWSPTRRPDRDDGHRVGVVDAAAEEGLDVVLERHQQAGMAVPLLEAQLDGAISDPGARCVA